MSENARKTERGHWDGAHAGTIRLRLPSALRVDTLNFMRLARRYIRPQDRVLEIGCAPGKSLAWVAAKLGAQVAGLDYSEPGIAQTQELFTALGLPIDLHYEDLFASNLAPATFDVVYSLGVIEHFDDPRPAVAQHLRLLKPAGVAFIAIPDLSVRGFYGKLASRFEPRRLEIHNLDVMSVEALPKLVPPDFPGRVQAFRFGRLNPALMSLPRFAEAPLGLLLNGLGVLQPFDVPPLCPWLVLEARKSDA